MYREIPGGTYTIGSPEEEEGRWVDEVLREVVIETFLMKTTAVTQEEWKSLMGNNPSYFEDHPDQPVECVSWFNALAYCNALSEKEGLPPYYEIVGNPSNPDEVKVSEKKDPGYYSYRLPTEEEWEVAARAGSKGPRYEDPDGRMYDLDEIAWYWENSDNKVHPVALKKPNVWGLYDMLGNIWEWTESPWKYMAK